MTPLSPALEKLETAQLIRPLAEPERAYFFRHILVQESAYVTLLKHERRALHRTIALALENQDRTPAEELARHLVAADMPARAAHYYTLAAQLGAVRRIVSVQNARALSPA